MKRKLFAILVCALVFVATTALASPVSQGGGYPGVDVVQTAFDTPTAAVDRAMERASSVATEDVFGNGLIRHTGETVEILGGTNTLTTSPKGGGAVAASTQPWTSCVPLKGETLVCMV